MSIPISVSFKLIPCFWSCDSTLYFIPWWRWPSTLTKWCRMLVLVIGCGLVWSQFLIHVISAAEPKKICSYMRLVCLSYFSIGIIHCGVLISSVWLIVIFLALTQWVLTHTTSLGWLNNRLYAQWAVEEHFTRYGPFIYWPSHTWNSSKLDQKVLAVRPGNAIFSHGPLRILSNSRSMIKPAGKSQLYQDVVIVLTFCDPGGIRTHTSPLRRQTSVHQLGQI